MSAHTAQQQVSDDGHSQTHDDSEWPSNSSDKDFIREHGGTQVFRDEDHSAPNNGAFPEENDLRRSSASAEEEFDIGDSDAKLDEQRGRSCDQSSEDDSQDSEIVMTISTVSSEWSYGEQRGRPPQQLWNSMERSVSFLGKRSWSLSPSPSRMRNLHLRSLASGHFRARPAARRYVSWNYGKLSRCASCSRLERRQLALNDKRGETCSNSHSKNNSGLASGVDDVEPEERLCETCRGINAEVLASGYEHLHLGELVESADACRLCERLKQDILLSRRKLSFSDRYTTVLSCEHLFVKDSETNKSVRLDFPYFTNEDDPAVHYGVRSRRWLTTTKSEKSFEIARTWLHECLECKGNHAIVEQTPEFDKASTSSRGSWLTTESSSFGVPSQDEHSPYRAMDQLAAERPSRLIDLHPENTGPGVIRLVPSLSVSCQYMTLSYCWGKHPNPEWITTRENVQKRHESFSSSELPATLFDAVFIADRMGARYLWIDALCIVQNDVREWEFEGGRMAGIYRGAVLCIAASSSTSSVDGILNERSTSHFERFAGSIIRIDGTITARGMDQNSERAKSTLYLYDDIMSEDKYDRSPMQRYFEQGPLSERAWALQERLLSPRILHYTREQLGWQCEHCSMLEDRLLRYPGDSNRFKHEMLRVLRRTLDRSEVRDLWYLQIVPVYSKRKLTYGSDKLIAISALARAMALNRPDVYLAGLWRASLIEGLLWRRDGPGCKSGEYRAPSWSWASQDSWVRFEYRFWKQQDVYDFMVIDSKVEIDESNAMGKVLGGFIKFRARAIKGVVMKIVEGLGNVDDNFSEEVVTLKTVAEHRLFLWDGKASFTCGAYMDNDDIETKTVVCVDVGVERGLLLQCVASEAGVYERVGLTVWSPDDDIFRRNSVSGWPWKTMTVR